MINDQFHRQDEPSWSVGEMPYHRLARDRIGGDTQLLYLLASASFIEITSDLYTGNLVEFFGGDHETVEWLQERWQPEELQHGEALKRYVQTAWPDFEWDAAYGRFFAEFSKFPSTEGLAPTRALVMVAQCVVETGTSSFYTMLANLDREPLLTHLATRIRADEIRHYKYFYRYFRKYYESERPGRVAVLGTLLRRAALVHSEDALIAFKHIHATQNFGAEFRRSDYVSYRNGARRLAKGHFPIEMAMKMLLKPLGLGGAAGRIIPPLASSLCSLFLG